MHDAYAQIREEAECLAGAPSDIAQRVVFHHALFLDSGGNHAFPQVALHGALWAWGFFEVSGRLGTLIQQRYFYDAEERTYRMGLLDGFAEGFKKVNRAVFVDTYTNYRFTERYGREPGAEAFLHPDLLAALNGMHAARARGETLPAPARRHLYTQALLYEQEATVAPGVRAEIARFDCPILRRLCLSPLVRFAYFPRFYAMLFRNFGATEERIARALRSYELAEAAGWPHVVGTMRAYGALPDAFFDAPRAYAAALRADLLGTSSA